MQRVNNPKDSNKALRKKAEANETLPTQLVRGLEDIREGRVKPWKAKATD